MIRIAPFARRSLAFLPLLALSHLSAADPPTWPATRDGLLFVWENSETRNTVASSADAKERPCIVKPRRGAHVASDRSMDLAGGAFVAENADRFLLDSCRKTNELTIEAVIRPANLKQGGPARIVTFSRDPSNRNFTLGQEEDKLVLRLRTPRTGRNGSKPQLALHRLAVGQFTHVVVTYRAGEVVCYCDGTRVFGSKQVSGDFSNWEPCHLLFGNECTGDRDWAGTLEGVAIYSRAVSAEEAKRSADAYRPRLAGRSTAPPPVTDPKPTGSEPASVEPNPGRTEPAREVLGADFAGAKIVAIQETNVLTVDFDTGDVRTLASFGKTQRFRGLTRPYWSADGQEVVFAHNGQAHRMNADGSNRREILKGEKVYEAKFWDDPKTGERCILGITAYGKHWYPQHRGVGQTYLHRPDSGTKTKLADFPFSGMLSPDGTHLGDAYGGCLIKEMATGKVHVLYAGKQACNSSFSPDNTYRLMHLYLPHKYFGFRNKFDKELWRFDQPADSGELQTPRWSNHPDFCCATAKYGAEYKILVIHIPTKKYAVLHDLPGTWRVPLLWLRSGAPGGRGEAEGTALTEADAVRMLEEARTTRDALAARGIYRELAAVFADRPVGKRAKGVLASPAFRREVDAATKLEEFSELRGGLTAVAGSKPLYTDPAYLARNRAILAQMVDVMNDLRARFDGTMAAAHAAEIARRLALPEVVAAPVNEQLVLDGTIVRVSSVPSAQQIAPYTRCITFILYRVDRVLKGKRKEDRVLVAHWGMKGRKHTPAASWKPGLRHRLTLDMFDTHKSLRRITRADDTDAFELLPWWALNTVKLD